MEKSKIDTGISPDKNTVLTQNSVSHFDDLDATRSQRHPARDGMPNGSAYTLFSYTARLGSVAYVYRFFFHCSIRSVALRSVAFR